MKTILISVLLLITNICFSQSNGDIFQKHDDWFNSTKSFKRGGNELPQTLGLLKTLLTDSTTRFKYEQINPKIGELLINGGDGFAFDDKLITFKTWVNKLPVYDSTKVIIEYHYDIGCKNMDGDLLSDEYVVIYDQNNNVIGDITIYYDNNNLRSIFDGTIINHK